MHYRKEGLSLSYFASDHPENAPIRERIKRTRKRLNLESPVHMWLYFLRYYLDTPHTQIGLDAMKGTPMSGNNMDLSGHLFKSMLNPDAENFEAITYQLQSEGYYLGIVQAASGEEFVLGHNGFGLWEGVAAVGPQIHRLFIISPRIALLLRMNMFRPGLQDEKRPFFCNSDLLEIRLPGPTCSTVMFNSSKQNGLDALNYKASSEAKNDQFQFPITKLTKRQTYLINSVVMLNARQQGSLTFLTPQIMRSTVRTHWRNKDPEVRVEQPRYVPLIRRLTSTSPAITGDIAKSFQKIIRLPAPRTISLAHSQSSTSLSPSSAVLSQSTSSHPPAEVTFPSSFGRPGSIAEVDDHIKLAEKTFFEAIDCLLLNTLD